MQPACRLLPPLPVCYPLIKANFYSGKYSNYFRPLCIIHRTIISAIPIKAAPTA